MKQTKWTLPNPFIHPFKCALSAYSMPGILQGRDPPRLTSYSPSI